MAEQIERFFFENSTLGEWNREAPMSKHLLELSLYGAGKLHWPEQDFSLLQDYPNRFEDVPSSIDDGLENCKPVENIKPNQSRTRFRRVGVVEAVNPIWLDMTGEKPKNYIPEYGDERGDFLQGVFNILWIEESAPPNARRAVDEHRKFFEQLKKKEYSSLRDFLRHRF